MRPLGKEERKYRGAYIKEVVNDMVRKNSEKNRANRQNEDTDNRRYVIDTIINYMTQESCSIDEAVDKIMQDPIVKKFKYLENNGLEIKNCFKNWANGIIKKNEKELEK